MKNRSKRLLPAMVVCGLLLCGAVGSFLVLRQNQGATYAVVYQGSTLLYKIDLSAVGESYTISIEGANDAENVILVEPGRISMASSNCPDKLCVRQGAISDGVLPIVCLPHKIRISIVSEEEAKELVPLDSAALSHVFADGYGADRFCG